MELTIALIVGSIIVIFLLAAIGFWFWRDAKAKKEPSLDFIQLLGTKHKQQLIDDVVDEYELSIKDMFKKK